MPVNFRQLRPQEIPQAFQIRIKVFVEEQKVPLAEEIDADDQVAQHFGLFTTTQMVGTARLLIQDKIGKIGRIALLKEFRGRGFGSLLIRNIITVAQNQGAQELILGAQLHAQGFYEKLGFKAEGSIFLDGGLPHRTMRLRL